MEMESWCCMDSQTLTGQVVLVTRGVLRGVSSIRVQEQFPGLIGSNLHWHSVQKKAEYIAASSASCEATWLCKLFKEFTDQTLGTAMIYYDNHSCIKHSKNPMFHDRFKHIEFNYYLIRDRIHKEAVVLQYILTDQQAANILTKPLAKQKFKMFKLRVQAWCDEEHFPL